MRIPLSIPSRARQHLDSLRPAPICFRRLIQTSSLPVVAAHSFKETSDPQDLCPSLNPSKAIPSSPPSNTLKVSAARTHSSTFPVGLQFKFHTGTSLFAKRPSRPFPPPFNPLPSPTSTSPLRDAFRSFHFNRPGQERGTVNVDGDGVSIPSPPVIEDALGYLRGVTNGDDAVLISPYYIGVADGVGAWNTRPQGHAALWSRLILHFWAIEIEQQVLRYNSQSASDRDMRVISPLSALQASYETTTAITTSVPILGTTTACIALLLPPTTLLLTNLGDSQAFVFRPSENKFIARTEEQWHWFDCPRQLGTNSPDTPEKEGKVVEVQLEEEDVLVVATDGLMDNLWEAEVTKDLMEWIKAGEVEQNMAENLVEKAKAVAGDPWGLSPYMERAVEQGLGIEGGKWDDISVVVARCKKIDSARLGTTQLTEALP